MTADRRDAYAVEAMAAAITAAELGDHDAALVWAAAAEAAAILGEVIA
jgi:hypothetical protein